MGTLGMALGILAAMAGVTVVAANYSILLAQWRGRNRRLRTHVSLVPVVGPILIALAALLVGSLPVDEPWVLGLACVLDPGTAALLLGIVLSPIRACRRLSGRA